MGKIEVERVLIVGAGQMGHQIAMLCALGGYTTILQDVNNEALQKAEKILTSRMNKWVEQVQTNDPRFKHMDKFVDSLVRHALAEMSTS